MLSAENIQDMYNDIERIQSLDNENYIRERLNKDLKRYIIELSYCIPTSREIDSFLRKVAQNNERS